MKKKIKIDEASDVINKSGMFTALFCLQDNQIISQNSVSTVGGW